MKTCLSIAATFLVLWVTGAAAAPREYLWLGHNAGVVTRPDSVRPEVALLYLNGPVSPNHSMCTEMASRGFLTWCGIQSSQAEATGDWTEVALEIKSAVEYLRRQPGIRAVVLYGHSGGGATASFYQAVAENGAGYCQAREKLSPCGNGLAGLPPADAVVFPDAHPGMDVMSLRGLNPSVVIKGGRVRIDPALDPFSRANGYNPDGASHYSAEFQRRYYAAQAAEMKRLVDKSLALRKAAAAGAPLDPATNQIVIPSFGIATHLDELDPSIALTMSTTRPERVLHNDGSITVKPIHSVWTGHSPMVGFKQDLVATSGAFLALRAVRAEDSMTRISWCSANSDTVCNSAHIHVPVLFLAAGASDFITDEERMYDGSPSLDKEYLVVEGALHGGQPCTECERTPGQYSNSLRNQYDYLARWINQRFGSAATAAH